MQTPALPRPPLLCAALLICVVSSARAQSVRFLRPDHHQLVAGNGVLLRLESEIGARRELTDWSGGDVAWFFSRIAGTQENHDAGSALFRTGRKDGSVTIALQHPGVALVGLDLKPRIERVPGSELRTFLDRRVGNVMVSVHDPDKTTLPDSNEILRVRRFESCKLLLRVVDQDGNLSSSADAQGKSGQRAEIRPLADPLAVRVDRDLPVRIYLPFGAKQARVLARHISSGRIQEFVTGPEGTGHFRVDAAGSWTIEAHGVRRLAGGDPHADYEITSATLAFEVPATDDVPDAPNRSDEGGKR